MGVLESRMGVQWEYDGSRMRVREITVRGDKVRSLAFSPWALAYLRC